MDQPVSTTIRPRRWRKPLAALTALALAVTGMVAVTAPAAAAEGSVSGVVFRDFNGNGVLDSGNAPRSGVANDTGLAGVTVVAYDASNALVGSAVESGSDGSYAIDTSSVDDGTPLRIEFSSWPTPYAPSGTRDVSSASAGQSVNGTSVQFVSAGAESVDFALNVPGDYAQDDAPIVTAIQRAGSPLASEGGTPASLTGPAVAGTRYSDNFTSSQPAGFPGRVTLAQFGEVGAVDNVVYQASSNSVFALATVKRQSGLRDGLGAIYRITDVLDAGGELSEAGDVGLWFDVETLGIDLGEIGTNVQRGLSGPQSPAYDTEGFQKAGKAGFGGATLSPDGNTLYFVNLHDKRLYAIDVSDPAVVPTTYESWDLGLDIGERPWAVGIHQGSIYVGYVDSHEIDENGEAVPQPGISAAVAGMQAHVIASPLSDIGAWATVLTGDLGYAKGDVYNNQLAPQSQRWNTWTDTWTWPGGRVSQVNNGWHIYPQPILSGFYFDEDNYLTLAFSDRTAVQGGNRNYSSDPAVPGDNYETGSSGDLLIAAPGSGGTYVLENDAVVGDRTGTGGNNEGPGGQEFYNDSQNIGAPGGHREITLGSAIGVRGTGEVVSTAYDPLTGIRLSGLAWYDVTDGRAVAGYELTPDGGSGPSPDGTFQKGGGLGAVTLLADLAPVEIGNRVWFDADQDGIQDADEPAIAGVTVELRNSDGDVIATTTTDANGEYYFRSDEITGFEPNGTYTVTFVPGASGTLDLRGPHADLFGDVQWEDAGFTESPSTANPAIDSNPDPLTGEATVVVGGPGKNDHTIDAGFIANVEVSVRKAVTDAGAPAEPGQTFSIELLTRDFRGAPTGTTSYTLADGEIGGPVVVPVGSSVRATEQASDDVREVDYVGPGTPDTDGYYRLVGTGSSFELRVDNTLREPGTFVVSKAVTGDFDLTAPELADAEFVVVYSYPGGSGTVELNADNGWTAPAGEQFPVGTQITLQETLLGAAPSVGFGQPTWSVGDQGDGSAVITIGDGTTTQVGLSNPTTELRNTFTVTKLVTGDAVDRVPAGTEFTIEYATDPAGPWTALPPVTADTMVGPDAGTDFPVGTLVYLREVNLPGIDGVDWDDFVWGAGVTPATADTPAYLTVAAGDTAAEVTLTNVTEQRNGQFSLVKLVEGPVAGLAAGLIYTVEYAYPGQPEPSPATVTLTPGDDPWLSAPLPEGTEVTVTEVGLDDGALPDGATWATPTLTIDGAPADNGASFVIGDGTTAAIEVVNTIDTVPSVDIVKGDGDAATGAIANDANTVAEGEVYAPGETRDIVIRVENTGPEPLRNVSLTDVTLAGGAIENLAWTFPGGGDPVAAVFDPAAGEWTAAWAATFEPGEVEWAVGDVIVGTATLTIGTGDGAHQDLVSVDAVGAFSGTPVGDEDPYNAFTGAIQVIKYAGQDYLGDDLLDPQVRDTADPDRWVIPAKPLADAGQDANTPETAVEYPVDTPRTVRWVVTNTGDTWLTDLTLTDVTLDGPEIGADWTADLSPIGGPENYSFVNDGPWPGLFAPGASFFAEGTLSLPAETTHADRVDVVGTVVVPETDSSGQPTDQPATDGNGNPVPAQNDDGTPFTVDDDDPFHAETGIGPDVEIRKGDGSGTTIVNEADTMGDGEAYQPGETRTIVFRVTNTGDEPLIDVVLTDETIAGGTVQGLEWTLPDGTPLAATQDVDTGGWTASWAGVWQPGEVITGAATLTLGSAAEPHVDRASVTATGIASGAPVDDENDYNAFTGSIQVIKYDGHKPDPEVGNAVDGWIIPGKPLADLDQDANDRDHAVEYPVGTTNPVRWVVTNTGETWLTNIRLTDVTDQGPAIGDDWTADLSAFGGPSDYSFADSGPWRGLLPPGASFFAEGSLTLEAEERHADTVDVIGTVVVPAVGDDGLTPNDEPLLDGDVPVQATVPDPTDPEGPRIPFDVFDDDPFHAWTGVGPYVDIEKGDGTGTEIVNDADTMRDGQLYENGETREIVFRVQNTGDEDLIDVVFTDETLSGATVESLVWTLPEGETLEATQDGSVWTARWEATFTGDAVWQPGEWVYGTATLTLDGGEPHVDRASVEARGIGSGIPVGDRDDYNAFTAGIQVIKYDGDLPDPLVRDADGNWIVPEKPLVDADQDANDRDHAVRYEAGEAGSVRWVVTNTGSTWLTSIDLTDLTESGPAVTSWTADLSAFGGPAAYDFVANGTWHGLIPPGASFFAGGTLVLGENTVHADTVTVEATPVVPDVDENGVPTGGPEIGPDGNPVLVTDADGNPIRLSDSDPFHAYTPAPSMLPVTGATVAMGLVALALLAVSIGAFVIWRTRRRTA